MKPVPKYWPKDQDKKLITFLYRAFRPDMDEFNDQDHPARHVPRLADGSMSDAERLHILRSIHKGSWERSPYLHCSLTVTGADSWHQMAVQDRGEDRQKQVMCRLDLWNMYQQDLIGIDDIIDLSSRPAFQHFLLDGPDGKQLPPHARLDFDHMATCVIRSTEKKEVLLKWRGKIDASQFEVISDFDSRYSISGYSIGTLDKFIDRALWDHWEGGYDHGAILKEAGQQGREGPHRGRDLAPGQTRPRPQECKTARSSRQCRAKNFAELQCRGWKCFKSGSKWP